MKFHLAPRVRCYVLGGTPTPKKLFPKLSYSKRRSLFLQDGGDDFQSGQGAQELGAINHRQHLAFRFFQQIGSVIYGVRRVHGRVVWGQILADQFPLDSREVVVKSGDVGEKPRPLEAFHVHGHAGVYDIGDVDTANILIVDIDNGDGITVAEEQEADDRPDGHVFGD
jgi:hypothetical protein